MKRSLLLFSLILYLDASAQIAHWEQLVSAYDTWSYFKGDSEPPSNWNSLTFNDSSWLTGPGSIGYGDGDDSTIITTVPSVYMRKIFVVHQKNSIKSLVIHADFDDGFIAYLNGVEIARANVADSLRPPAHNDLPMESREPTTHNGPNTFQGGVPAFWVIQDSIWKNALTNDTNVLAVHTLDSSSTFDLTSKYWLHCATTSTSPLHDSIAPWFEFNTFKSNAAVIRVNSYGKDIVKQYKVKALMDIVWASGDTISSYSGETSIHTNITIRKRGNGSLFTFPKNGYLLESQDSQWEDVDISPLGMPEEEDWILHGPWLDRTYSRNALAMHLARSAGHYASRTSPAELFINGRYEGIYILMEEIKRDKHRVDIAKLKPDEVSGDDLTGGYIWRVDWGDEDWFSSFYPYSSTASKLKYQYHVPGKKDIVNAQETYLQATVDDFEHALQNTALPYKGKYWDQYLNVESFVDYFLIQEFTKNYDAYRASAYFHKDKNSNDSLIKAGPVWDFNYSLGLTTNCQGYLPTGWYFNGPCAGLTPMWWNKLVQTTEFANRANCRWKELRQGPFHNDSIENFLTGQETLLKELSKRDRERWFIEYGTAPHYSHFVDSTIAGDMTYMTNWITQRLAWMDSNMIGMNCTAIGLPNEIQRTEFSIHPNPSSGTFHVTLSSSDFDMLLVRNNLGQIVYQQELSKDKTTYVIRRDDLDQGMYFVELKSPRESSFEKLIIRR